MNVRCFECFPKFLSMLKWFWLEPFWRYITVHFQRCSLDGACFQQSRMLQQDLLFERTGLVIGCWFVTVDIIVVVVHDHRCSVSHSNDHCHWRCPVMATCSLHKRSVRTVIQSIIIAIRSSCQSFLFILLPCYRFLSRHLFIMQFEQDYSYNSLLVSHDFTQVTTLHVPMPSHSIDCIQGAFRIVTTKFSNTCITQADDNLYQSTQIVQLMNHI